MSLETGDSCLNLLQESHRNMSLTRSMEYSMQTEDKSLPQSLDDSVNDLFNQYVNMDRPNIDGNKEKSLAPSLDVLFVQETPSSGSSYVPVISSPNGNNPTPQPWRKGLWCLHDTALSATERHAHLDKTVQPSAVSGCGFDNGQSSQSQNQCDPLTPSASTTPITSNRDTNSGVVTSKTIHRRDSNDRRNLLRKYNSSPTLTRTTNPGKHDMSFQALRAPKSQNFASQHPEKWASFPSPSAETRMGYGGNMSHLPTSCHNIPGDGDIKDSAEFPAARFESSMLHQSQTVSMPLRPPNIIGQHNQFNTASGGLAENSHLNTEGLFHSPYTTEPLSFSSEQQSFSSWNSDFTNNVQSMQCTEPHTQETQTWWSTIPTRFSQPYSPSYEPMIMAPVPRRIDTNLANSTSIAQSDIGTQFHSVSDVCSSAGQYYSEQATSPSNVGVSTPYPSLPTSQSFSLDSLFSSSSRRQTSPPSRSPSVSPTVVTLPRRGSTTNTITSGPATRALNSKDHRRTHNRKHSTPGNNPRGPRASTSSRSLGGKSSNGALNVSFVNFTPDDSQKILTGVAPSGSSKTKARREQEAREKRRKLSEAALTAIRRAGGDVDDLQSVFC